MTQMRLPLHPAPAATDQSRARRTLAGLVYEAHRQAGFSHADALAHTRRDVRRGLWQRAFPGSLKKAS